MIKIYNKSFHKSDNPFALQQNRIRNSKLAAGYRLAWTEEGILGQREAEAPGVKVGRNISAGKITLLVLFLCLGIFALFIKTAYLQIIQGDYYTTLANANRVKEKIIPADRGIIYDKDKNVMAYNTPIFYLQVVPAEVINAKDQINVNQAISKIDQILGEDVEQDLDYILVKNQNITLQSYQPQIIADNIEHEKAINLKLILEQIPGLSIEVRPKRKYNLPSLSTSHILGYTGMITEAEHEQLQEDYLLTDVLGKTGIEKYWEPELRGKNGKDFIEVDALGQVERVISRQDAQDGYNLLLALDSELQKKLEDTVAAQLDRLGLKRAAAIVMNPRNGEILAMVSMPSFDSNDFSGKINAEIYQNLITDDNRPLFNRAISGNFAIGSTFKPIVASAALQEGIIDANTTFNSVGGIAVKSWFFPDWKPGGHGITNVRKALAWSVNTFFYNIGGGYQDFQGLGVKKIIDYAKLFNMGSALSIDIPGEASGFLPSKEWKEETKHEQWYIGDTYNISIGQGDIIATPLQVASFTSFFANGGTIYRPHFVKALLNKDNTLAQDIEPQIIKHDFIDKKNINIVRNGLRDTVVYGSASSLQAVPVDVAGKTGTAQWSSTKNPHSWFTGFAPFDDPQIVITVLVEEGSDGLTSASVPIAREVLQWYFTPHSVNNSE